MIPTGIEAGIVFIGIGLLLLANRQKQQHAKRRSWISATGKVVQLVQEFDSDSAVFYPLICFDTVQHGQVTERSNKGEYPSPFRIGQKVYLVYNPANPAEFLLSADAHDGEALTYGMVGLCMIIGALLSHFLL